MTLQLVFNGLVTGIVVSLPAIAVSLVYSVLRFTHFGIGAMLTMGAYVALVMNVNAALPLWVAITAAAVFMAAIGAASERLVFRPLQGRPGVTLLVASMGLAFVLENTVRLVFGNTVRAFAIEIARPFRWFDLRMNREQLTAAAVAIAVMAGLHLLLHHSAVGRAMRAVADNATLAAVRGIDRGRVSIRTMMIAGALTGIGGALIGMDRAIDPLLGWNYIISVFAAAILGGLGSPVGAVVGALVIGVVEELATLVMPSTYRMGIGFVAITVLLIYRPQGLFGHLAIKR